MGWDELGAYDCATTLWNVISCPSYALRRARPYRVLTAVAPNHVRKDLDGSIMIVMLTTATTTMMLIVLL